MNQMIPPPVPTTWTTATTEAVHTGSWRAALPRHVQAPSPCHLACPVNGDIATWIRLARERDFRGAWEALTRHNPFPAIAGRVCHHPCESACNRSGYDEPLSICRLERFVGDLAIAQRWSFAPPPVERDASVAVVGGGPAGLALNLLPIPPLDGGRVVAGLLPRGAAAAYGRIEPFGLFILLGLLFLGLLDNLMRPLIVGAERLIAALIGL